MDSPELLYLIQLNVKTKMIDLPKNPNLTITIEHIYTCYIK